MRQVQIIRPDGQRIVLPSRADVPRTEAQLRALHLQREEIGGQLGALRSRRNDLDEQQHAASGPARTALEARIAEVDARRAVLESQLDGINDRIANAPTSALISTTEAEPHPIVAEMADKIVPLAAMFSVFFLFPLALAFARLMWKRGTQIADRPAINEQLIVNRLEQLQTSMDAMSLEVERISEGQRYLTKLNADREKAALPR